MHLNTTIGNTNTREIFPFAPKNFKRTKLLGKIKSDNIFWFRILGLFLNLKKDEL